jgi:hypothetical protein
MTDDELRRQLAALHIPPADPAATERALRSSLEEFRSGDEKSADLKNRAPRSALEAQRSAALRRREWLWPSPLAWGALAAVWVAILSREAALRPAGASADSSRIGQQGRHTPVETHAPAPPGEEYRALLRDLQQLALRR